MPDQVRDAKCQFIDWELRSRDIIDVKRAYVHIAGDLAAGVLLSQIVYWFLPTKSGESKVSIARDGRQWLAKQREEWWEECCITPKQFDRCAAELEAKGLISTATYRFNGLNVKHVSLNWTELIQQVAKVGQGVNSNFPKGEVPTSPKGKFQLPQRSSSSITETTAETTAEMGLFPSVQKLAGEQYDFNADSLEAIPQGLALVQYAMFVLEHCNIPGAYRLRIEVGEAIRLLAKEEKVELGEATRMLALRAKAAIARGETVNSFWIADCKWKRNGEQHDVQRSARNAGRDSATIDAARRAALSEG